MPPGVLLSGDETHVTDFTRSDSAATPSIPAYRSATAGATPSPKGTGMYHNPGITNGIGAGAAGVGGLAATGFEALWVSAAAISLVVGGLVLLRTSRLRRAGARPTS